MDKKLYVHVGADGDIEFIGPKVMDYKWRQRRAWLPRKCVETGAWIKPGERYWHGTYNEWVDMDKGWIKHEYTSVTDRGYIMWRLKHGN